MRGNTSEAETLLKPFRESQEQSSAVSAKDIVKAHNCTKHSQRSRIDAQAANRNVVARTLRRQAGAPAANHHIMQRAESGDWRCSDPSRQAGSVQGCADAGPEL